MSFDLSWFTSPPGLLLTGGVLLLVIALIMLLVSSKKGKKAKNPIEEANTTVTGPAPENPTVTAEPSVVAPAVADPNVAVTPVADPNMAAAPVVDPNAAMAAPADPNMVGVVAEDEGRGIGRLIVEGHLFLRSQIGDVTRSFGHTIEHGRFTMIGVEHHDTLVGQHEERGVVMIVALVGSTNQHFSSRSCQPVYLRGLDTSSNIDTSQQRDVDSLSIVSIVDGARVCEPAPGTLLGNNIGGPATHCCCCHQEDG